MPKRPKAQAPRIRNGVVEYLCSNPGCPVGWRPLACYGVESNGSRKARCKDCLNRYQRDYWRMKAGGVKLGGTTAKQALDDLDIAWPEPIQMFEDKGKWDYDRNEWYATPFDYASLPDPKPIEPEDPAQ